MHLFGFLLAEWSWRRHLLTSDTDCDLAEPEEFDRVGRCCSNWSTRSLGATGAAAWCAGAGPVAAASDTDCS